MTFRPPERKDELLLAAFAERPDPQLRAALVERYLPLARSIARRYARGAEPLDDLFQVASVGLIKALDRFDPARGVAFSSFAVPTIAGELRRYFRDRVAAVHIPRPVTDLRTRVTRAAEELTNREGQSPSIQRLAEYLEVSVEDVLEAVQSDRARTAVSLSALDVDGETEDRGVPVDEAGYDEVEARLFMADALETLDDRDRLVLRLRFEEGLSQSEIAARIGISQMHVSRLLRRAFEKIRDELGEVGSDEL